MKVLFAAQRCFQCCTRCIINPSELVSNTKPIFALQVFRIWSKIFSYFFYLRSSASIGRRFSRKGYQIDGMMLEKLFIYHGAKLQYTTGFRGIMMWIRAPLMLSQRFRCLHQLDPDSPGTDLLRQDFKAWVLMVTQCSWEMVSKIVVMMLFTSYHLLYFCCRQMILFVVKWRIKKARFHCMEKLLLEDVYVFHFDLSSLVSGSFSFSLQVCMNWWLIYSSFYNEMIIPESPRILFHKLNFLSEISWLKAHKDIEVEMSLRFWTSSTLLERTAVIRLLIL